MNALVLYRRNERVITPFGGRQSYGRSDWLGSSPNSVTTSWETLGVPVQRLRIFCIPLKSEAVEHGPSISTLLTSCGGRVDINRKRGIREGYLTKTHAGNHGDLPMVSSLINIVFMVKHEWKRICVSAECTSAVDLCAQHLGIIKAYLHIGEVGRQVLEERQRQTRIIKILGISDTPRWSQMSSSLEATSRLMEFCPNIANGSLLFC